MKNSFLTTSCDVHLDSMADTLTSDKMDLAGEAENEAFVHEAAGLVHDEWLVGGKFSSPTSISD